MFEPQTATATWRERISSRRRDRKQRRAWRRERRKGVRGLEDTVLQAEKREWERTDFFNKP
jgi:hypothetical protein